MQLEPSVERRAAERNGGPPTLARLNAHGIRLPQPAGFATVIFLGVFYLGGLYEELRLGSRSRLPRCWCRWARW